MMHRRSVGGGHIRRIGVVTLDFRADTGRVSTVVDVPIGRDVNAWRRRFRRQGAQLVAARDYRVVTA